MDKPILYRFIRGLAATTVGTFFNIVLGMFSLMIAVRYVSKEHFGEFILILIIAGLLGGIGNLIIEKNAIIKLISSAENSRKVIITNVALTYQLLILIIMSILIFLFNPLFKYIFDFTRLNHFLIFIPLFFMLESCNYFLFSILKAFHHYKKMAISQILDGLIKLSLIVLLVISLKMGILGLMYAFLFSLTVSNIFQFCVIPVRKRINFNVEIYKEIFTFGFPLGLNSILTVIFTRIDRIMIGAMMSPIGVANYDIASKLPDSGIRMGESFISVFFPHMSELFAQKKYFEATKILSHSLRLVTFVIIFATLLALLFREDIIQILFSKQYLESAPALSLLMIGLCIFMIGNILGTSLVALGQSDKPVKINAVDVIIHIIGNLIMIPVWGFMGAVYSTLLARAATNPIYIFYLMKSGINVKPWVYLKPFIVFLVCSVPYIVLGDNSTYLKLCLIFFFLILSWSSSIVTKVDILNFLVGMKRHQLSK